MYLFIYLFSYTLFTICFMPFFFYTPSMLHVINTPVIFPVYSLYRETCTLRMKGLSIPYTHTLCVWSSKTTRYSSSQSIFIFENFVHFMCRSMVTTTFNSKKEKKKDISKNVSPLFFFISSRTNILTWGILGKIFRKDIGQLFLVLFLQLPFDGHDA